MCRWMAWHGQETTNGDGFGVQAAQAGRRGGGVVRSFDPRAVGFHR